MASSDNLASIEPWLLRSAFASDLWFSDADFLTKSISAPAGSGAGISPSDESSLYDVLTAATKTSPNPDTPRGSGSDPETAPSKRSGHRPVSGRVGKRKPRASKKNPTTYITADAANFRHMVQQVTGVKFPESAQIPSVSAHILKPEPQRFAGSGFGGRIQGYLPTLDTSAFLLGLAGDVGSQSGTGAAAAAFALPSAAEFGCDGGGAAGLGFDSLSCFPTLDSWKAL